MEPTHPNIDLLRRLDPADMAASADVFADDVVFHYFNPALPGLAGDYRGLDGIKSFFDAIAKLTGGTFKVNVIEARAVGDELVVVQTRNEMTLQGEPIKVDVVVVWRIAGGKIVEVWDIPAVHGSGALGEA